MKPKCPSEECPCNQNPQPEVWKCLFANTWIYTKLPDNMRPATRNDFFPDGKPRYGLKFLAKSFFSNQYHAMILSKRTNIFDLSYFITANQTFVQESKQHQ